MAREDLGLLASGILFAVLLCLKHIYLYLAPAYFVYLLRTYCVGRNSLLDIRIVNCIKLGVGIGIVAGLAFGPFAYYEQIPQVLDRLFPFSRGLCHAYWAPNVWAMYSFSDRVLIFGKARAMTRNSTTMLIRSSGALREAASKHSSRKQRHARPSRRHLIRCSSQHYSPHDPYPDTSHAESKPNFQQLNRKTIC